MQRVPLSPAVVAMLSLRMDAAHGTPTVLEKLRALIDPTTPNRAAILQGEQADLTKADQALLSLLHPIIVAGGTAAMGDLANFLQVLLGAVPQVTSLQHGVSIVSAALAAESGPLQKQAVALGQSMLTTLISAALGAVGHTNLPLVG